MSARVEFVIVGQGLAGTALAWALLRRGRTVLVIDRGRGGSSRVAGGLITSVTGKRLAKSWRWEELYPFAARFYTSIEAATDARFFRPLPALRLFGGAAERDAFARKWGAELRGLVWPAVDPRADRFHAPHGGFELAAARLDVQHYLAASRVRFLAADSYLDAEFHPGQVEFTPEGVRLKDLEVTARSLVLCRGFGPEADPWFGRVRFRPAKGEILTVRVPGLSEERVVHGSDVWLAPLGGERFRAGATYSWDRFDSQPTAQGRAEIDAKLRALLRVPFQVVGHDAAVRPIVEGHAPALGRHPRFPALAYFNGLGSKGALLAPFFADQLAAHLCGAGGIEPAVDVSRFLVPPPPAGG
jgi:glycine/D-amino acid oxidase-like deaminating enzyme